MDITPSKRPWILMTAEAALGRRERLSALGEFYDVIIVPAEYFQQAVELLDQLPQEQDGKQNEVLQPSGLQDVNN